MKIHWIAVPVLLLIGILIGRISKSSEEPADVRKNEGTRLRERPRDSWAALHSTSFGTLRDEIRKVPSDKMPGLLKRSLTHPDLLERRELILECLQGMDSRNWREMVSMFGQVTRETGMTDAEDWLMSLMLAGRTGTEEAAECFLKTGDIKQQKQALWGWSQVDPNAALVWLREISTADPDLRGQLLPAVIGGAVQRDGIAAMDMLEGMSLSERMACVGNIGWNLVERDGIDSAIEWAIQTRKQAAEGEDDYAQSVYRDVTNRIYESCKNAGGARDAALRMARIVESDTTQLQRFPWFASQLKGTEPFEFFAGLSNSPALADDSMRSAVHAHLSEIVQSRPEAAAKWLGSHPNDPLAKTLRDLLR